MPLFKMWTRTLLLLIKMWTRTLLLRRELWSFVEKTIHRCLPEELVAGDCWIALSLASLSGLILAGHVGKHTDELAQELICSTEGKTYCKEWGTDAWQGYGRVLTRGS